MIDTNIESLAIKAEIKQKLREEMGNSISEDDMKFLLKTQDKYGKQDAALVIQEARDKIEEKRLTPNMTPYIL